MALFSFSLFNVPSLTAALRVMDLLELLRSNAAAMVAHQSRRAAARRSTPTLSRLSASALRLLLLLAVPIALALLCLIRLAQLLPRRRYHPTAHQPTTVLLTAHPSTPSTARALSLARALHASGHTVHLATSSALPSATRFSAAVASAHRLRPTSTTSSVDAAASYEHEVLGAVLRCRPAVWVPCELLGGPSSGDNQAALRDAVDMLRETLRREAGRAAPRVRCGVLAPEGPAARLLVDGERFAAAVEEALGAGVETGFAVPVVVRSRGEVHAVVHARRGVGRRFLLERVGGGDGSDRVEVSGERLNETYERVARLEVSRERPWAMREVVEGEVYRAHAVVVRGSVGALAVSRADGRAARVFLSSTTALHGAVAAFVEAFVAAMPGSPSAPLAIDFIVRTGQTETGTTSRIHPLCCSWDLLPVSVPPFSGAMVELVESCRLPAAVPQPEPAAKKLENSSPHSVRNEQRVPRLVHGATTPPGSPALSAVDRFVASTALPTPPSSPSRSSGSPRPSSRQRVQQESSRRKPSKSAVPVPVLPPTVTGVYSLPHTLLVYILLPLLDLLYHPSRAGLAALVRGYAVVVDRVLLPAAWSEELWDRQDPGPWVWEWGVRRVVGGR